MNSNSSSSTEVSCDRALAGTLCHRKGKQCPLGKNYALRTRYFAILRVSPTEEARGKLLKEAEC
ncbi:MAG: hypothetical protein KME30_01705 [Iphinoe sp. HA4291-MV1]|nr:hypothetical protein [Iphinoe sp. HA4291-MV1]